MKLTERDRKTLHGLLRELLSARDGPRCLYCLTNRDLEMSHIFPKGTHRRLEFDPDNLKFLCATHHRWWHANPKEAKEWLKQVIPKERLQRITMEASRTAKMDLNVKAHKLFLEAQIKKLNSEKHL